MQTGEPSSKAEGSRQSATISELTVPGATGPRTREGKRKSKRNALKHGLFSQAVVLKGEQQAEFDSLLNGLRRDCIPDGTLEEVLVEKLAAIIWRYRRLLIVEGIRPRTTLDSIIESDDLNQIQAPPLDLSLRTESNLERSFDRTLSQLERVQRMRLGQPVPPRVELDVIP